MVNIWPNVHVYIYKYFFWIFVATRHHLHHQKSRLSHVLSSSFPECCISWTVFHNLRPHLSQYILHYSSFLLMPPHLYWLISTGTSEVSYALAVILTQWIPCQRPTSLLKSSTQTITSPAMYMNLYFATFQLLWKSFLLWEETSVYF